MPVWLVTWFFGSGWKILAVGALAVGGYFYVHNSGFSAGVKSEAVKTQQVTAEYAGYRATVASAAAAATAHAMAEQKRLQDKNNELQGQLAESQRKEDAKSKALQALLSSAKAADMRLVGPSAGAYYERLRADAADRAAGP